MFIRTENSTYEVDQPNKLIRRLNGKNPCTSWFETDMRWQRYQSIHNIEHDERPVVVWGKLDKGITLLSVVLEIDRLHEVDHTHWKLDKKHPFWDSIPPDEYSDSDEQSLGETDGVGMQGLDGSLN